MRDTRLLAAGLVVAAQAALAAATIVVTPARPGGWAPQHANCSVTVPSTGTQEFVVGPGEPPAGRGSYAFTIGRDASSLEALRSGEFHNTPLAAITQLSYATFARSRPDGHTVAPYLNLLVDRNGDGQVDDQLFFEPIYQDGAYYPGDPVPNQGGVLFDTWQTWDALAGGWWALSNGTGGPPLVRLATYLAAHPEARIVNNPTTGAGGFRVAAGCGTGEWAAFSGSLDRLTVGVGSTQTTYDFEVHAVPTARAQCAAGGWRSFNPSSGPFASEAECTQFLAPPPR
jgi:hypothetical protein